MIKMAIIGSRNFDNYDFLEAKIQEVISNNKYQDIAIVSGGAKGADSLGEQFAIKHNIPTQIYKPDWKTFGKRAGFIRNHTIINNSDVVVAFWDMQSKGTKHSIDLALSANKVVHIFPYIV